MEKTNGVFYFTNGTAKVAPSLSPVNVLTHDSILWFLNHEKDTICANFHIQGELSLRNKEVLEAVLREQKNIDVYLDTHTF